MACVLCVMAVSVIWRSWGCVDPYHHTGSQPSAGGWEESALRSVLVNDPGRMTMSPIGQWWRVRFFMPLGLHQNSDFIFLYLFTHWLKKSHTMFSAEWCHFCGSVNTVKHFFSFELLDNFWLNQWHEFGGRLRVGLNNWILKECPLLFLQSHGLAEFSSSPN